MSVAFSPEVLVYICHNSLPPGAVLRRQWTQDGLRVVTHGVPCSGKMDGQYLMHAIEGGARGFCVVACPKGECHLSQGNYRAEIRVQMIRRLLGEAGLEPQRAELLHSSPSDSPEEFHERIRDAVARISALGANPIGAGKDSVTA
jgi:F420-non-reducing hydrogenase iron-sulfur subunit